MTTTTPQNQSAPPRFAGLDGLRSIAVVTVILFHLSPGFVVGGYLGVDVFFVISGFLITALLLREHSGSGRIQLRDFWRRRARRLLPALAVLLLVSCAVALVAGGNVLVGLGRQVLGATTFSSNWLSIAAERSYFTESNPELFRNLWSLAVEEQFYLIWPLLLIALLLIRNRAVRAVIIGLLAAGSVAAMAVLSLPAGDPTRVYYGTDTHSFGLALGALLAVVSQRWSPVALAWPRWSRILLPTLGAVSIVTVIALALTMREDAAWVYPGGLLAVSALTVIAIAGSVLPGSMLGTALDVQPLRWIGERSYGLYLWHWPVFVLVVAFLPTWARDGASGWALGGIALGVTVIASTLSYRFIEQPIRRGGFRATFRSWFGVGVGASDKSASAGKRRIRTPQLVSAITAGSLVLSLGAASVFAVANDPGTSDSQAIIEAGEAALAQPPRPRPDAQTPEQPSSDLAVAIPTGDGITAIGDSVMLASAPALQEAFPGIRIDAVVSRQLAQAPALVRAMMAEGTLRPTILLGLGTNGPIDENVLSEIRSIVGPKHEIVVVNVQAPRGWTPGVNSALAVFAREYRNVEIANWHDAIAPYISTLARDQVHPGPTGAGIYVKVVTAALQRLAELPPVLTTKEYGLAPRPL